MAKKTVTWVTVAAFLVFSWSCVIYRWAPKKLEAVKPEKRAGAKICALQLKSGQKIEFSKKPPARIQGDSVVGQAASAVSLERSMIKKPKTLSYGQRTAITTEDGTVYRDCVISKISRVRVDLFQYVPFSVPLTEVELLWVKKVDALGTALLYAIPIGVAVAVIAIGLAGESFAIDFSGFSGAYSGSCLLVYSHDGADFACDAEPFAGAIAQGLERTEWSRLDHCREVDGQYRLLGSNSLEESQYLDELKLVAVDHPPAVRVVPDLEGKLHTVFHPLPPRLARDGSGADITQLLAADDEVLWASRLYEKNPAQGGAPKDELILEFPRPAGADRVKIVADARTTLLGSLSVKSFLALYGQALPAWYEEVGNHGPAYQLVQNWLLNEELYRLHIQAQTRDGWISKAVVYSGGPFISKEKAYLLDISDVPGDVLRIKLTPAAGFWLIDSVMADYSPDLPLEARELSAVRAVDRLGRDLRAEIARTDQKYFIMPIKGETAEFVFDAPGKAAGLERTLLLKASGHYQAHLAPVGAPRWDIIAKFIAEPGFTVRYAWNEFERWAEASAMLPRERQH